MVSDGAAISELVIILKNIITAICELDHNYKKTPVIALRRSGKYVHYLI
jgi:hypothetical protein